MDKDKLLNSLEIIQSKSNYSYEKIFYVLKFIKVISKDLIKFKSYFQYKQNDKDLAAIYKYLAKHYI